jgi:hypothetical protein
MNMDVIAQTQTFVNQMLDKAKVDADVIYDRAKIACDETFADCKRKCDAMVDEAGAQALEIKQRWTTKVVFIVWAVSILAFVGGLFLGRVWR